MRLHVGFALLLSAVLLHCCISEARSIDSSNSLEILLRVLLGGRGGGGMSEADGSGSADESVRSTLETLQQHVAALVANISSLERIDTALQRIQDMAEDTHTVQEDILEYLGLEGEEGSGSSTTELPTPTTPASCDSSQFTCDNGNCIRGDWRCDGNNDCGDGSDEVDEICRPECSSNQFTCDNGNCIRGDWRCDGGNDCGDGSDEVDEICRPECSSDQFTCDNGNCIGGHWRCDGVNDCGDGSDEVDENCRPDTTTPPPTTPPPPTPPPVLTGDEEITLEEGDTYTIRHPESGGSYHNNERFSWVIRTEDSNVVGFKIDAVSVSVQECCDKITIPTPGCHFLDVKMKSTADGPVFVPGPEINITFTSNSYRSYDGFTLEVSTIINANDIACPNNEKYLSLGQNSPRLEIVHPEDGGVYENYELYVWIIKNEDPEAVGFEVTFDKIDIDESCDILKVEGDQCTYSQYTTLTKPSVTIRGDTMNITWTSDEVITYTGFILGVSSLYELNKTQCYDYICDEAEERCFSFYDVPLTWHEGQAACEADGGRLAVITDEQYEVLFMDNTDPDFFLGSWIGNMTWTPGHYEDYYGYDDGYYYEYDTECDVLGADGVLSISCDSVRPSLCERIQ